MNSQRPPANPMTVVLIAWLATLSLAIGSTWFVIAAVDQVAGSAAAARPELAAASQAPR